MTSEAGERPRGARKASGSGKAEPVPAAKLPVARVAVDVALPHLDRLFDYLVPESLAEQAVPGCRVKVRFSGRLTAGFLIERSEESNHQGRIAFLNRVISSEPVLTTEIAGLARAVADRYGGTVADVLRLAIPPRHAKVEAEGAASVAEASGGPMQRPGLWERYPAGPSFLSAVAGGRTPHAVWTALPGQDWPVEIAQAAAAALTAGRGTLVVVPDARDLELVAQAMSATLGEKAFVSLAAQLGPAERYRRWLAVLRRQVNVVVGTRSAMFAPVAELGLVVIWDDGDDLHAEPRAPYPHARDVLLLRAHRQSAAALIGGFARTAEAAQLVATGWARTLAAERPTIRQLAPAVRTAGDDSELARDEAARTARIPGLALRTAREALGVGPVLFQVPRRGYLAAVACRRCGERIRCGACGGPVALAGPGQPLRCGWCGATLEQTCVNCGNAGLRALVTGARRTAEELGRAFPGVTVHTSSGANVLRRVGAEPALVIATPGAEPPASGGYAAAVLLDGWALLGRPSLRAAEEALRRWMNASALVRPGMAGAGPAGPGGAGTGAAGAGAAGAGAVGGKVVIVAEPEVLAVQALIRWDAATHADRELAERAELRFPPTVRMAALTGPAEAASGLLGAVSLPAGCEILGPVDVPATDADQALRTVRYLVRAPSSAGTALAVALRAGLADRSARKEAGTVRLQLDPAELI
ncbi:MAG TPA: primosomal protein N' [Streptosporangiaceae bacterium]|nr:primosomal protein N' [Streptosporangiaceae bacterium]